VECRVSCMGRGWVEKRKRQKRYSVSAVRCVGVWTFVCHVYKDIEEEEEEEEE